MEKEKKEEFERHLPVVYRLYKQIQSVIVGQEESSLKLILCPFSMGQIKPQSAGHHHNGGGCCHILEESVPGLAKSLRAEMLALSIAGKFKRIQMTPDQLPSDLTGTLLPVGDTGKFEFAPGPIFANIILVDEINRATPKTQSALIEAMAERQVTVGTQTYKLEDPFLVIATQNPIEQEGTYPLPEAQLDRFAMKIIIQYPTEAEETEINRRQQDFSGSIMNPVISLEEVKDLRDFIFKKITVPPKVENYIIKVCRATRPELGYSGLLADIQKLTETRRIIKIGASPRASIFLTNLAKTLAFFNGREKVIIEDVRYLAFDVLRHRIILDTAGEMLVGEKLDFLGPDLESEGLKEIANRDELTEQIIKRILRGVEI